MKLIIDNGTYSIAAIDSSIFSVYCFDDPIGIYMEDVEYTIKNDLLLSYEQLLGKDIVIVELKQSEKTYPVWDVNGKLYRKQHRFIMDYFKLPSYLLFILHSTNNISERFFKSSHIQGICIDILNGTMDIGIKTLTIDDLLFGMVWDGDFRKFMNLIKDSNILTFSNGGID